MMVVQIKQKIIAASFLLVAIIYSSFSQNVDYYSGYAKFRFGISVNYYLEGSSYYSETDTPVTYMKNAFLSPSYYFDYNFFSKNRHKFFIGYKSSYYYEIETLLVQPGQYENTPVGTTFKISVGSGEYIYSLSLQYQYSFKIRKLHFYSFVSLLPGYIISGGGWTEIGIRNIDFFVQNFDKGIFRFNSEIGFGFNIKTKYLIIQPHIFYNKSFTDIRYGEFSIKGIRNRPYTEVNGKSIQSGDYFAFGLHFIPVKFWKKNK